MTETLEQLNKMEELGFKLFGDIFKDTLTYIQIQRKKKALSVGDSASASKVESKEGKVNG